MKKPAHKLDYNNFTRKREENKQSFELRQWARSVGVSTKTFEHKIETHPHLADIRVLLDIRSYSTYFNKKDEQVFNKIWRQVYEHEYPLTAYHKRKLQQVINSIEYSMNHMKKTVTMKTNKGGPLATTKLTDCSL